MQTSNKSQQRIKRHARIRAKISGTPERPRLAVFRSNRFVYAQLIDDTTATTLASADSRTSKAATARERAAAVGAEIAELGKKKGVTNVVLDRGGFQYQGVVAAFADGARKAGLVF